MLTWINYRWIINDYLTQRKRGATHAHQLLISPHARL